MLRETFPVLLWCLKNSCSEKLLHCYNDSKKMGFSETFYTVTYSGRQYATFLYLKAIELSYQEGCRWVVWETGAWWRSCGWPAACCSGWRTSRSLSPGTRQQSSSAGSELTCQPFQLQEEPLPEFRREYCLSVRNCRKGCLSVKNIREDCRKGCLIVRRSRNSCLSVRNST